MKNYFEKCLSLKRRAPPVPQPQPLHQRYEAKQAIIAMKGAPFTRKTEFANQIAKSLKCPVLSLDHYLDVLHPHQFQSSTTSSSSSPNPQDLAFQIICRITASHLSEGVSDNVVIDSPLSSRSHLDQLIELASSLRQAQLVIIECKPTNIYLWQTKFEECNPNPTLKWYKAKNWDDVDKAIKDYYDERSEGYNVPKLVLDPLSDSLFGQPNSPYFLSNDILRPRPFIEALEYIMNRDAPDAVIYRKWQQSHRLPQHCPEFGYDHAESGRSSMRRSGFCKIGHSVTNFEEEGLEYEANCMACGEQVVGAAYTCEDCSLALHKECAESFDSSNPWGNPCPDFKFNFQYRFPKVSVCVSCKEDGKNFSRYCDSCLFETHLKCRLTPTIIRHDCDEHFLSLLLPNLSAYQLVQQCEACGKAGRYSLYLCKICKVAYHFKCLTEVPHRVEHLHGGHRHQMLLKFSSPRGPDHKCLGGLITTFVMFASRMDIRIDGI